MPIQFGVLQGNILGPLLFIMYIDDLTLAVRACCVELYASDMLIFLAGKSVSENESRCSSDPGRLISWFQSNFLMLLNVSKTKIMLVGTHQGLNAVDSFSVAADNTSLQRMDTLKYLGVTMDEPYPGKNTLAY